MYKDDEVRDEAIRDLLDRGVRSVEPDPDLRLLDIRRQGTARRAGRVTTLVVSVAVFVTGVTWGAISIDRAHRVSVTPGGITSSFTTYHDAMFGWTISYPRTLQLGHFAGGGLFTYDGIRVTNFTPNLNTHNHGQPDMGWLESFPPDGVALQIWFGQRLPVPPPARDTSLPITLASLKRARPYVGGNEPAPLFGGITGDGTTYAVAVWFGPQATSGDRAGAETVLRSLAFPRLTPWSLWRDWYYVLGSATDYPAGSATLIPASKLPIPQNFPSSNPIYLVHATRGFYAVSALASTPDGGTCDVQFDRASFTFSCPALGLMWDRLGTETAGGRGDIGPHPVSITIHGQLVFCPFFGPIGPRDLWG